MHIAELAKYPPTEAIFVPTYLCIGIRVYGVPACVAWFKYHILHNIHAAIAIIIPSIAHGTPVYDVSHIEAMNKPPIPNPARYSFMISVPPIS